jgi:hypothetical protein
MKYPDHVYIRAPEGTIDRIERARKDEKQADFLRRVLVEKLDELDPDGAKKDD